MNLSAEEDSPRNVFSRNEKVRDDDGDDEQERSSSDCSDDDGNVDLQDSEFTVDSVTNEPIPGTGWFGGIGTEFLHCLTDNVSPVVSGVATLVHKTAVAVANEISQLERDGELRAAAAAAAAERTSEDCGEEETEPTGSNAIFPSSSFDSTTKKNSEDLILPWEVCQESSHNSTVEEEDDRILVYFTDAELMEMIFDLSRNDSTFLQPFSDDLPETIESQKNSLPSCSSTFVMDEPRVKLINRILDIDGNLASARSRLTGDGSNFSETCFWKNYFFHCERVRVNEFCRRKRQNEPANIETQPCSETKLASSYDNFSQNENDKVKNSKHSEDEESLIPVGSDIEWEQDDNSSFVIQSAPNTGDTFATTRSIDDDLVLVDTHGKLFPDKKPK